MDQLIEMAKDLAREIQEDQRYIRAQMAQAAADEDEDLQALIGEFNLKRMAINNEAGKPDRDPGKLERLDTELRDIYAKIMENPHMKVYNTAKAEVDALVGSISRIITLSAQGVDPDEAEDQSGAGCGGSCAGCSGCH